MTAKRRPVLPRPQREITAALHERLESTIRARGLTTDQFALDAGIHRGSVYRILNGTRRPTAEMVARICRALDISADYLLCLSPDAKEKR